MKKEDQVVEKLIRMVLDGDYDLGDRLPAERHLSEKFQISRHTLRGAVRQLEARGLLEVRSGSGCYIVAPPESLKDWNGTEIGRNRSNQGELLEAYFIMSPMLGAVAAEYAADEDIETLENCLTRIGKAMMSLDTGELAAAHRRFMDQIARCAHNRFIAQAGQQLSGADQLLFDFFPNIPKDDRDVVFADYVEIVNAIKKKNSELAATRIRDHIVRLSRLMGGFQPLVFSGALGNAISEYSE